MRSLEIKNLELFENEKMFPNTSLREAKKRRETSAGNKLLSERCPEMHAIVDPFPASEYLLYTLIWFSISRFDATAVNLLNRPMDWEGPSKAIEKGL